MVFCTPWKFLVFMGIARPEGTPRTEVIQYETESHLRRKSCLQRLANKRLRKCFCILDVRQGTILVALLELVVFFFGGIMVAMDLWHELEIKALIISEVEDSPARKSSALSELSGREAMLAEVNNESRLRVGLHLANYRVLGISCVLMYVLLHIVASALLLLGAVLRKRGMLLMWVCMTTTDLSITICGTIVAVAETAFREEHKFGVIVGLYVAVSFIHAAWLLYKMVIAISLYIELLQMRHVQNSNLIRNLHINIRPDWNKFTVSDIDVELLSGEDDDDEEVILKKSPTPDLLIDPSSDLMQTLRDLK